ncbi:TPA: glycosyltransferase [Vibrio vulnificus]|nr:glycosyltransferase [Vibrio vulnificus]HDY8015957.1 glycosyltransferase [Vibrio vulnificus]
MKKFDYLIITNVPAFYKINLYNKLSEFCSLKVIFLSKNSKIRNDDFSKGIMKFEHEFLFEKDYESRNKFISFIKIFREIFLNSKFNKIIFCGWEIIELIPFSFILNKRKLAIVIESSIHETRTSGLIWYVKKKIINRFSLAFPSGKLQSDILKLANFNGDIVETYGVGIQNFKKKTKKTKKINKIEELTYLYVGRISKEKNILRLVEEFDKHKRKLLVIGTGPLLETFLSNKYETIEFLGYVDNTLLGEFYQKSDAFILPSTSEPWGLVVEEALINGLPVIVSNKVGSSFDLVESYKSGVIFDLNKSLIETIEYFEDNYLEFFSNVSKIDFEEREFNQLNAYLSRV